MNEGALRRNVDCDIFVIQPCIKAQNMRERSYWSSLNLVVNLSSCTCWVDILLFILTDSFKSLHLSRDGKEFIGYLNWNEWTAEAIFSFHVNCITFYSKIYELCEMKTQSLPSAAEMCERGKISTHVGAKPEQRNYGSTLYQVAHTRYTICRYGLEYIINWQFQYLQMLLANVLQFLVSKETFIESQMNLVFLNYLCTKISSNSSTAVYSLVREIIMPT